MATCPECGSIVPEFGECPTCGARLAGNGAPARSSTCQHCGERISSEAEACPACGHLRVDRLCTVHPQRAAVGTCVVCGTALCEECNEGGEQHYLCAAHASVEVVEGWAQVYSTSDDLKAQLIRENLQAEGVDARVLSQKDHFSLPVDMGDLSPVRVLVPAYTYQDAVRVISDHMDSAGEVVFACPNCGEVYDSADAYCASCGQPLTRSDLRRALE